MLPRSLYRTVVLETAAQEFVDEQSKDLPRFEQRWMAVEWLLARNPESGTQRVVADPEVCVYVFPEIELAGMRELWVLYSFDYNEVTVRAVRFADRAVSLPI